MKPALLAVIAALYGLIAAWTFRRFTNASTLRTTVNHMVAHILELHLFIDEPRLIFRAQRDLLLANFQLLRQIAVPTLLLALPFSALYVPMDRYFGAGPLRIGEPAVVEARSVSPDLDLIAPFGVSIETPGLRIPRESVTVWRVRALSPVTGEFRASQRDAAVIVHAPAARILGMPWMAAFALASTVAAFLSAHVLLQKLHAFKRN